MSGPERIWAHPTERCPVSRDWQRGKWKDHDSGASGDVEYIRADTVAEMIRQAVQAKQEACAGIAETMHEKSWPDIIAAAIRARGDA